MSDRDAGSVSIRFSVKDAETVRQALERLGKDGQRALGVLDAASRQPARGVAVLSEAALQGRLQLQAWAGQLGSAGAMLARIGPTGLVAAGAVGGLAVALYKASQSAHEFADEMLKLRDTAQTLDLTTSQLQAVEDAGAEFALSAEKVGAGLQRMNAQLDEARKAQGKLFETVEEISPALAIELASTKDMASALDVLGKAYRATDDAAKKAALSRAAFGRSGFDVGLLIGRINELGGVRALTEEFQRSGDIAPGVIDKVSKLKAEIDDMAGDARRNIQSIFSENVLALQHSYTEQVREVKRLFKDREFRAALKEFANVTVGIFSLGLTKWRPFSKPAAPETDRPTDSFTDRFGNWPSGQTRTHPGRGRDRL